MREMWLSTPESSTGIYADSIGLEDAFVTDGKSQPASGWRGAAPGAGGVELRGLLSIGLRLSDYRCSLKPLEYALSVPKPVRTFDVFGSS